MFQLSRYCSSAFLAAALLLSASELHAQRAIPDDNLAYPVFYSSPTNTGSGFYLNTSGSVYFVTAKHNLFDEKGNLRTHTAQLLSYSRDPKDEQNNLFDLDLFRLKSEGRILAHPRVDAAVVKIATMTPAPADAKAPFQGAQMVKTIEGVNVQRYSPSGILGVARDAVKQYDDVLVGNEIIVFGYPNSIGLQQIPQIDPLRPLLRKGIIAGKNPSLRTIIIDVPSFPGNSGGPVVQIVDHGFQKQFAVIGIVSQFVPFDNSRFNLGLGEKVTILNSEYSVVTPMDSVLELTNEDMTGSLKN
ncbi:MAG: hypothetical protein QOD11_3496 [Bradyrhizobium sp.]|jgi:hypothetical protein|nr:hypothetical protein [Bradyrhizobium sp.]